MCRSGFRRPARIRIKSRNGCPATKSPRLGAAWASAAWVGLETKVSKQDAGRLAHAFLGGMLVVIGFIVCAMLGVPMPNKK